MMKDRLAVQSDQLGTLSFRAVTSMKRIKASQVVMQPAKFVTGREAAGGLMQTRLEDAWKFCLPLLLQIDAGITDCTQRVIHAIDARARHDAQNQGEFHFSWSPSFSLSG